MLLHQFQYYIIICIFCTHYTYTISIKLVIQSIFFFCYAKHKATTTQWRKTSPSLKSVKTNIHKKSTREQKKIKNFYFYDRSQTIVAPPSIIFTDSFSSFVYLFYFNTQRNSSSYIRIFLGRLRQICNTIVIRCIKFIFLSFPFLELLFPSLFVPSLL